MKIERLVLVNFCKYRGERVFDFTSGLTAIIGPNGVGKSNILGGIRFTLTGENPNVGSKAANICFLAPQTERSYAELTFTHGTTTAVVRRNIRPARPTATLTINGIETVEGDLEVTSRIEQILGISTEIINDIVIVGQDEIFGFLDKLPAKRAEQFQRLFRTEQAAVIYKHIGDHLKTVEVPSSGVDIDDLRRQINEAQQRLSGLEASLANIPGFDAIQQQRESNADVIRQFDSTERLRQQFEAVTNQYQAAMLSKAAAQTALDSATTNRQTIMFAKQGSVLVAEAARANLANIAHLKRQTAARSAAVDRVASLQQRLAEIQASVPAVPRNYTPYIKATEDRYREVSVAIDQHQKLVASFSGATVACPTCATPVSSLLPRLTESRELLPRLRQEQQELQASIAASRDHDQLIALATTKFNEVQQSLAMATSQLDDMPAVEAQTVNEAELQAVILGDEAYAAGIREYDQIITQQSTVVGRCDGQVATLYAQLGQIDKQLRELPAYTAEQRQIAVQAVQYWDTAAATRRNQELATVEARTVLTKSQEQLEAAQVVATTAEMLRSWHGIMNSVRDVFHKDAAPRFVAQRNLQRLQHSMNESLEMFATDFRVQADDGLSFMANFIDGSRQPAERLSGGQKVILALSFRLSLNLMFAENIGALYLDEPTAWLDEHHIRGFEPVLERLRQFSAARGLQSIIITHERGLAPLFDSVISL